MDDKVLGLWTEEEFQDVLAICGVVAVGSFFTTLLLKGATRYFEGD